MRPRAIYARPGLAVLFDARSLIPTTKRTTPPSIYLYSISGLQVLRTFLVDDARGLSGLAAQALGSLDPSTAARVSAAGPSGAAGSGALAAAQGAAATFVTYR